jgi:hypothetical protein
MRYLFRASLVLAVVLYNDHVASAFQNPHPHVVVGPSRVSSPSSSSSSSWSPAATGGRRSGSTALFGIPKMFRWLTDQYPNILNRRLGSATSIPPIDNFYLDMNGIIHPCTHGNNEDEITILDETEMFKKIFGYVDRLYKIVQPKKVLYLAVDGVSASNG